jgi:5-methylcytosine-specific restriction endonuclease McrBC regulatory subunit McrC
MTKTTDLEARVAQLEAENAALKQKRTINRPTDRFGSMLGKKAATINSIVESSKSPVTAQQIVEKANENLSAEEAKEKGLKLADVLFHLRFNTRAVKGWFQHDSATQAWSIHPDLQQKTAKR